jgi:hypothetical protein
MSSIKPKLDIPHPYPDPLRSDGTAMKISSVMNPVQDTQTADRSLDKRPRRSPSEDESESERQSKWTKANEDQEKPENERQTEQQTNHNLELLKNDLEALKTDRGDKAGKPSGVGHQVPPLQQKEKDKLLEWARLGMDPSPDSENPRRKEEDPTQQ